VPDTLDAEAAVRLYLLFLDDPEKLRDEAEVKKLTNQVEEAKDPVDKLKAIAALERAQAVDGEVYEQAFVANARSWAEAEDVSATAFQQMGVPNDILTQAGFEVSRRGRAKSTTRKSPATRVTAEAVRTVALGFGEAFTTNDLQASSGGSLGTVRKVLAELVNSGELGQLGVDPNYSGRGRAPSRYQKA